MGQSLDMPPSLTDAEAVLRRAFGYASLRAPQRRAIAAVLAGRDVLVVMPTGGGKSLCFQVPALLLDGLTVVLSPLVSLMKDQVDVLVRRGITAAGVHGGVSPAMQADALAAAVRGRVRLLYVAPERLAVGRTLAALARSRVALLAVDEAHCISEWGHDFRPAYRAVREIRRALGTPPAIALTATATPEVRRDIADVCGLRAPVQIVAGFDRVNLRYSVQRVANAKRRDAQLASLVLSRAGPAVVYAQSRARTERIAAALRRAGAPAVPYHAGQDPAIRRSTQDRFMRGDVEVIVATSAFGMGVDKPDVRLVLHDALSPSLEAYYQEAGRAGRDGRPAECVLLYAQGDRRSPDHFIAAAAPAREVVEAVARAVGRAPPGAALDIRTLARQTRAPPAHVAGALAILERSGVLVDDPGDRQSVWVRLLATPARIAALCAARGADRSLLQALWRASRGAVARGASVPLDALPPGLAHVGLEAALDRLQSSSVLIWRRPGAGLRPAGDGEGRAMRAGIVGASAVDFEAIDARRRVAQTRLAAMIRYAEARTCRRAVLLEYFGDTAPRVPCGGCDRCA
jgi:ATP-dependent DNA helicase RecQ